jgi:hypothetical protein
MSSFCGSSLGFSGFLFSSVVDEGSLSAKTEQRSYKILHVHLVGLFVFISERNTVTLVKTAYYAVEVQYKKLKYVD